MTDTSTRVPNVPRALEWVGGVDGVLRLLDQTRLPREERYVDCRHVEDVWEAIRALRVRGAPAIGVAAAYGVVLGVRDTGDAESWHSRFEDVVARLETSRPTAVNLFWALNRLRRCVEQAVETQAPRLTERLLEEARRIEDEDRAMCAAIGRNGAALLEDGTSVLTHCNAGSLATAGDGTALAVIYRAVADGKRIHVYADETRPLWQGARLTVWELQQRAVPVTLICDSAAGWLMRQGAVHAVITGADRIAANGDTANKIGTYMLARLAQAHGIPFYVAAPTSTLDLSLADGSEIPIEQRPADEVTHPGGSPIAPEGTQVWNPAFDVTPAELITAIVTERGVIRPVRREEVARVGEAAAPTVEERDFA